MTHLTVPSQELDRLIRQTPQGMMFWSGTCADPAATCGGCKHYGYTTDAHTCSTRCALYKKHTGEDGASLHPKTLACKYFEARQS